MSKTFKNIFTFVFALLAAICLIFAVAKTNDRSVSAEEVSAIEASDFLVSAAVRVADDEYKNGVRFTISLSQEKFLTLLDENGDIKSGVTTGVLVTSEKIANGIDGGISLANKTTAGVHNYEINDKWHRNVIDSKEYYSAFVTVYNIPDSSLSVRFKVVPYVDYGTSNVIRIDAGAISMREAVVRLGKGEVYDALVESGILNCTVNYYDGEEKKATETVSYGETVANVPELTKDGYALSWKKGDSVFSEDTAITGNVDLYANWAEEIDHLFIGSSYISTDYWYNWGNAFGDLSAVNLGVPGSRIALWQEKLAEIRDDYLPENIVIYIGGNDINDGNLTGEETFALLQEMLESYHAAFPETVIHYATVVRSMLFKDNWTEDAAYYELVTAYANGKDWLKIIDLYAAVTPDENGSTQHWFGADGLHFGVDGYALFTKKTMESLGIQRPNLLGSTGLGDLNVAGAPEFDYAPGWVLENGVAHNVGRSFGRIGSETEVFVSGLYDTDFYAEVKLSVADCYCSEDAWPKVGLAIRTEQCTYFYFINTSTVTNPQRTAEGHIVYTDNWGNVFYRVDEIGARWSGELFNNYFYLGAQSFDHYTDDSYTTLAVAKLGKQLVFIANGNVVATRESVLDEDKKAAVSVFAFNMDVYAKDARFLVGRSDVEYELAPSYNVNVNQPDGAVITADKATAKAGDTVKVNVAVKDGYTLSQVLVNGSPIVAENGEYSFQMPDGEVTVTATFLGRKHIDITALSDRLDVSDADPMENDVVEFTAKQGYKISELYVNGVELEPTNGEYLLTVTEDAVVTGGVYVFVNGMMMDGALDMPANGINEYNAARSNPDRTMKIQSYMYDGGIYLFATVTNKTDDFYTSNENWKNNNIEVFINGDGKGMIIYGKNTIRTTSDTFTHYALAQTSAEVNGVVVYTTCIEAWIAGDYGDSVFFRVGCNGTASSTNNWFETGTYRMIKNHALNGDLSDAIWATAGTAIERDVNGAHVTAKGKIAANGIILGITIDQNNDPNTNMRGDGTEWWNYIGPEFMLGSQGRRAVAAWRNVNGAYVFDGVPTLIDDANSGSMYARYKTVDNGEGATYRYTTTVEIYVYDTAAFTVENNETRCYIRLGGNYGTAFAWLTQSCYITADGLTTY